MKKFYFIIGILFLILVVALVFRFILGGPEDTWICTENGWIKHGQPSAPMPAEPCGEEIACSGYPPENCPSQCVVCPPCPACSSISCQTEEFCAHIGFDRSWYEMIKKQVKTFEECVAAGNVVLESLPRQCRTGEQVFTEYIGNMLEKSNLIRLERPQPNEKIESPLVVKGEARGTWFFEASFPVVLTDWDGLIIGTGIAQAQDEWMTEDFVPFIAEIQFDKPEYKDNGALILRKDNPSGLPEYDDALEIPINFK